jgi:hypothetical protein
MRIQDLYVGAIPRFIRNIPIRCWGVLMMMILLLFLQKQNLASAIYLFELGTRLSGQGLKHTCERTVRRALTPAQGLERGRDGEGVKVMTVTRA